MDDVHEGDAPRPITVAELTAQIKSLLEHEVAPQWVAGEVSNLSRPSSGHCYFTLKDDTAQIRAVMWRGTAARLGFDLTDGIEILCFGRIDVYAPRGSYQLVVSQAEPRGVGALEQALRKLRDRLAAEGLFAAQRKRPLPAFPRRVAFVTSPTGAAIRDFLEVLRRRWQGVDVLVVPARVQGVGAAQEIADGIAAVNRLRHRPDVLVVGRGGGSLEDLWCFNEEVVVRAIAASAIPVVSAVGHEIDVTLSDLVADRRALTPSEAAELVAPSSDEVVARLDQWRQRMQRSLASRLAEVRQRLAHLAQCRFLRQPSKLVEDSMRQVDDLEQRLTRGLQLARSSADARLAQLAGRLESLSPLAVLGRGYSVTTRARDGKVVRRGDQLAAGDEIVTQLEQGRIVSRVVATTSELPRGGTQQESQHG
jgi:exodeoxyribonuclease VII large subunit